MEDNNETYPHLFITCYIQDSVVRLIRNNFKFYSLVKKGKKALLRDLIFSNDFFLHFLLFFY